MVAALVDGDAVLVHGIYEPMRAVDAARPAPLQQVLQQLGFSKALERGTQDIVEQGVDAFRDLAILDQLPGVVLPALRREFQQHYFKLVGLRIRALL